MENSGDSPTVKIGRLDLDSALARIQPSAPLDAPLVARRVSEGAFGCRADRDAKSAWVYAIFARVCLVILPVISVSIGYFIGDYMGLHGWWLVGLAVMEAMVGLLAAIKLMFILPR